MLVKWNGPVAQSSKRYEERQFSIVWLFVNNRVSGHYGGVGFSGGKEWCNGSMHQIATLRSYLQKKKSCFRVTWDTPRKASNA